MKHFVMEKPVLNFIHYIGSANFIVSVLLVLAAVALWGFVKRLFRRFANHASEDDRKNSFFRLLVMASRFLIVLITILSVLQINGINVSSVITGLGLVSAVVGLALQDILKDVIMGIRIITDQFFFVGDIVKYQDFEGRVIDFNVRATKIQKLSDNSIMTVSNRNISQIIKSGNVNGLNVPLSYEADVRKIHQVLSQVCEKIGEVEGIDSCVYKGTQDFEDSAVIYKIVFCCSPELKFDMYRAAMKLVQEGLEEAGLEVPYKQLVVHNHIRPSEDVGKVLDISAEAEI